MKIGYAYVVADLFHIGHLRHLETCKGLCDRLVVGVLTDEATMEKKQKPIIPYRERAGIISALSCVDLAVPQNTYSPLENAVVFNADILFESTSHAPGAIQEARELMAQTGGEVIVMPYYEGQSSTMIKNKIINEWRPK